MYPEFVFIKCGKHHRSWGDCSEGRQFYSQFSRDWRHNVPFGTLWGSTWGFSEGRKGWGKAWGKVYVTRQAGRLSSCVYVYVTLGAEAASGCLVSGSKEIIWILLPHGMSKSCRQGGWDFVFGTISYACKPDLHCLWARERESLGTSQVSMCPFIINTEKICS